MEPQVQRVDARGRRGGRGRGMARGGAVVACAVLTVTAGAGATNASAATRSGMAQLEVVVTHRTVRIGDGDNNLVVFANKSRAELCTPERIVYENALEAWFDSGQVGEPPVEPADSSDGVKEVTIATTSGPKRTTTTVVGDDLPVEVWRLDDEPGGIDCTATDGPGAERFAMGTMDFDVRTVETPSRFSNDVTLGGKVRGADGTRYTYVIRYTTRVDNGELTSFTSRIKLKPKH